MREADRDATELRFFGLPSLAIAAAAGMGILYAVLKLVTVAWPMARWMTFVPPE